MNDIHVSAPNFWWRAPADDIRAFVTADPDIDDGKQRWIDRDEQRWSLIAQAVVRVSDTLAAGDWRPEEDDDEIGWVTVDLGDLSMVEWKIVQTWFTNAEAVRCDPWFFPISNGRHRLWNTLNDFGDGLVPVAGDVLTYADPVNADALGPDWHLSFVDYVQQLNHLAWFDAADPVNARFIVALEQASQGLFPRPS